MSVVEIDDHWLELEGGRARARCICIRASLTFPHHLPYPICRPSEQEAVSEEIAEYRAKEKALQKVR